MGTTTSLWRTGTYDLLIAPDRQGGTGDLLITVFAAPVDPDNSEAEEDAPILAQREVLRGEYDLDLQPHHYGVFTIGRRALLAPADIEKIYGARLAARIMLSLYEAAEHDFYGTDMDEHPWRLPSTEAFELMLQVHPLLMDLKRRLFGT